MTGRTQLAQSGNTRRVAIVFQCTRWLVKSARLCVVVPVHSSMSGKDWMSLWLPNP